MITKDKFLKIALAHDSFTQIGGAERVVEVLHEIYPQAPVFSLVFDKKYADKYKNWNIQTSWLQKIYNLFPKLQYFLPLIPFAVASLNLKGFDLVISSSSGWMKNLHVPKKAVHINYCHTPARFLWIDSQYLWNELPLFLKPFYWLGKLLVTFLKKWDYSGAQRIDYFLANSLEVQKRIKAIYHKDSKVLYPCINTGFWRKTKEKEDYFLVAGRLQPHKNNELVIKAFNELGLKLHVVGTGRQENYLRSIARENIYFLGRVSDEALRDEYSGALGYIYPQVEDFGLMPLEAAACGTATLAIHEGGSLETVVSGITGEFFSNLSIDEIKKSVLLWDINKYQTERLVAHAGNFSKEKFKKEFCEVIENFYEHSH